MNRLKNLFDQKKQDILNVYFTAGYPDLGDGVEIIRALTQAGVDLIEVGIPYSDPLADGLTIQQSSQVALQNGMTLDILFDQMKEAREVSPVPMVLMGYYNQMLQYGAGPFVKRCAESGIDGLIIPDLPMDIYEKEYQSLFKVYDQTISFLITPETSDERILQADRLSTGFIYVVSKSSITGSSGDISERQKAYFSRIRAMRLTTPRLIGFGIHDRASYDLACAQAQGAIIGSAFIRALDGKGTIEEKVSDFLANIR